MSRTPAIVRLHDGTMIIAHDSNETQTSIRLFNLKYFKDGEYISKCDDAKVHKDAARVYFFLLEGNINE